MTTPSETQTLTTLGESLPVSYLDPRATIQVELLRNAPLKNEEIVELTAFICQAESIDPFIEHVITLRDRYDMTLEVRPLEVEILSLREKFPLRSLHNFFVALGDVGYHGLVMKVITLYQQDTSAAVYMLNLENAFGVHPDDEFVRDTLQVIETSNMEGPGINAVTHLFKNKLARISQYAAIPTYIRDFEIVVNQLPRLQDREVTEDMPVEFLAEYLSERLDDMDKVIEVPEGSSVKDELIILIEKLNAAQLDELISKFTIDPEEIKRIRANRDVFRVYGPVNAYPNTDFSSLVDEETGEPDVNLVFGGARMFTDLTQEVDSETGVPLDEWFIGSCMQCFLRIRSYFHAVREPGLLGGWSGCFCSWDCVRGSIRDGQSAFRAEGDISDPDQMNIFAIQLALTVQYEDDMKEIHIQDRDYDEDDANEAYLPEEEGVGLRRDQINQDAVEELIANIPKLNLEQKPISIVPMPFAE